MALTKAERNRNYYIKHREEQIERVKKNNASEENKAKYNQYQREYMRRYNQWKKIKSILPVGLI